MGRSPGDTRRAVERVDYDFGGVDGWIYDYSVDGGCALHRACHVHDPELETEGLALDHT